MLRAGWTVIKGAIATLWMLRGFQKGVVKFVIVTGHKPAATASSSSSSSTTTASAINSFTSNSAIATSTTTNVIAPSSVSVPIPPLDPEFWGTEE